MNTAAALTTTNAPYHLAAVAYSFEPTAAFQVADVLGFLAGHARHRTIAGLERAADSARFGIAADTPQLLQLVTIVADVICNTDDDRKLEQFATHITDLATDVVAESLLAASPAETRELCRTLAN